jgi:hypothetical protein
VNYLTRKQRQDSSLQTQSTLITLQAQAFLSQMLQHDLKEEQQPETINNVAAAKNTNTLFIRTSYLFTGHRYSSMRFPNLNPTHPQVQQTI